MYDCLHHHVISLHVYILNEHILGCASGSGIIGNTWTASSLLDLQTGFSLNLFIQVQLCCLSS